MHCRIYLALAVGAALASCSALPQPPPVIPVAKQRPVTFGIVNTLPYAPTRAVVSGRGIAPTRLRQRFGALEDFPAGLMFEPRLALVHRVNEQLHWSAQVGWWMSGLELRYLPLGDTAKTPVMVTAGAQLDVPALMLKIFESAVWDARALVTVHPSIGSFNAVLGAGLSVGRRKHDIYVPDGPLATYGVDQVPSTYLEALRQEGRVEAVLGFGFDHRKARFILAAQPFYVIAAGKITSTPCSDCADGLRVDSLDADWGAMLTFSFLL